MWRLANCPGSQSLITSLRQVGKYYELPNLDAQSGLEMHDWLAVQALGRTMQPGDLINGLSADQRTVTKKAVEIREQLINDWLGGRSAPDNQPIVEKRFYYRQRLTVRFSGQPDFILIDSTRALNINYKTGRKEAQAVADNLQLRTEIVLLKHNFPFLTEITAAIDEPFVTWDPELVLYMGEDLLKAEAQILAFVDRADWEREVRVAGPWCEYCPARAYCREARLYIETIPNPALIEELPRGQEGAILWRKLKVAKKLLDDWEAAYEKMLEAEPDALPGYVLPERGRARRRVLDPAKFKEALQEYLSGSEIDGCADYWVSRIEELLGIKHKIEGKELAALFKELTKDAITVTFDTPYIQKVTKREKMD
jgi:hypothetical protein